jgi:hypothetical protein
VRILRPPADAAICAFPNRTSARLFKVLRLVGDMELDQLNNRHDSQQGKRLYSEEIVRRLAEFPVEVLQAALLILQMRQERCNQKD